MVIAVLVLGACGGSSPSAAHSSPTVSSAAATASGSAASTPSSSSGPGPASLVHCTTPVPAGDNLAIGMVVGDPTVVVRDIQDPANAKNLCSFDQNVISPKFVNGSTVVYVTADNKIIEAPLSGNSTTTVASFSGSVLTSGQYAISPDGRSIAYIDGNAWHLVGSSGNRVLTTLPGVPGRGINQDEDDSFLGFSPDGQYIAFFQTFHTGGTGETAPDQIRRVSDGSLVYATSGMTMAVWASVPSRLFFRDATGILHRWDPAAGSSSMGSLHWIRPRSSPDGRWIAYSFPTTSGVHGVGFYSVQANAQQNTSPPGRSGVAFLTNDLVWYAGEKPCTANCELGSAAMPSGVTYIYSIAGASEITSRLASVYDSWPRVTAPGL
jgi:WD40-like Beta Propeller Repeat